MAGKERQELFTFDGNTIYWLQNGRAQVAEEEEEIRGLRLHSGEKKKEGMRKKRRNGNVKYVGAPFFFAIPDWCFHNF